MRRIYLARVDKVRPVLILTRAMVIPRMTRVTVAPITSTIRGLSTEVPVGTANGLDHACVVSCDNIATILEDQLRRPIGWFHPNDEPALAAAIIAAYSLEVDP